MLNAAFIQLPLLEPGADPGAVNVPLAAGYCAAVARLAAARGDLPALRCMLAPRALADYGGDEAIVRWAVDGCFDLIGFTVYLWNRERSAALAREIRRRSPGSRIVAGGPDLTENDAPDFMDSFDGLVLGEGETAITGILAAVAAGRPLERIRRGPLADLGLVPNPYLSGLLDEYRGAPIYLETMRGCPYRCAYCFYGKHQGEIRRFPGQVRDRVIRRAAEWGSPEIYLMDPSFNTSGGLDERLERLAGANTTRIPLHTELRLESVNPARADLMRRAGFVSVEAGLQSVNPAALAAVGRGFDAAAFARGARELRRAGIRIRTGVILGLPEDSLKDFSRTLDFVQEHELSEDLEIYPLAVLPATELREKAAGLGLRYMPKPPYWVLETPTMSTEDLLAAFSLAGRRLGIDYFKPLPPAPAHPTGFIHRCRIGRPGDERLLLGRPELIGNQCALLLGPDYHQIGPDGRASPAGLNSMQGLAGGLLTRNPFGLYQLILDLPGLLHPQTAERLGALFFNPAHPFNRFQHFRPDDQARFSTRLFQLSAEPAVIASYLQEDRPGPAAELMIDYRPGMAAGRPDWFLDLPWLYLGMDVPPAERAALARMYDGFEQLLIEAFPDDAGSAGL